MEGLDRQWTAALDRLVDLRPGTSDRQVWADTFTGLYHVPPDDMPVPSTVLDLGANIGLTAAHYHVLWPHAEIVAVEMDERSAWLAARNAPVKVVNRAVSAEGGWGTYDPTLRDEAYSFKPTIKVVDGRMQDDEPLVMSNTLRQLIRGSFLIPEDRPRVDFVKMDIEGEEWAIFDRPDWADLVDRLLVELHPNGTPEIDALDSDGLVRLAIDKLSGIGFDARHHPPHPRAVYATHR